MNSKRRNSVRILLVFIVIISIFFPSIRSFYNQGTNKEFIEKIENNVISGNIKIVRLNHKSGFNTTSISRSPGASGVIIRKEGERYFALTANHVMTEMDNVDKTQFVTMRYDDQDFTFSQIKEESFKGSADYYMEFPEIKVERTSEKYDLALISFESDKEFTVVTLAENDPEYGDKVAAMSNPYGKRNVVTIGHIGNKKNWSFEDEAGKIQYPIIKHSAVLSEGSSGSALLNEDLEIVGINLGGNENILHRFISGMAMPIDQIRIFLAEVEK